MPQIDKHVPGSFNWLELATTDQKAAKEFYSALFGWEAQDFPMCPDEFYTMFKFEGRDAAACFTIRPEQPMPPNWGIYMAVEDADKAAARAAELGGTVLKPPFDVFTFGRMAVILDPTGAVFSVWQAKSHIGTGIGEVPGTLCWADLSTPDRVRAKTFYEQLFGWEIVTGEAEAGEEKPSDSYLHIKNGEDFIGGIPPESERNQKSTPHWLIYFQVDDCDASAAKAKELGGRIYVAPMSIAEDLRFSVVVDPQGAVFALFAGQS